MTGFEPATSGSTIRRSNQLSYTHHEEVRKEDLSKEPIVVATDGIIVGHESCLMAKKVLHAARIELLAIELFRLVHQRRLASQQE